MFPMFQRWNPQTSDKGQIQGNHRHLDRNKTGTSREETERERTLWILGMGLYNSFAARHL